MIEMVRLRRLHGEQGFVHLARVVSMVHCKKLDAMRCIGNWVIMPNGSRPPLHTCCG